MPSTVSDKTATKPSLNVSNPTFQRHTGGNRQAFAYKTQEKVIVKHNE